MSEARVRSDRSGGAGSFLPAAVVFAGVALPPVLLRLLLLLEERLSPSLLDLRGLVSDFAAAFLVCGLMILIGSRWLAAAVALAATFFHYVDFETVRELGAHPAPSDFSYLTDSTFMLGSGSAVSHPLILGALGVAGALSAFWGTPRCRRRSGGGMFMLSWVLFGLHALWPAGTKIENWRQTHFVAFSVREWLRTPMNEKMAEGYRDPPHAMLERWPGLAADLQGSPIVPLGVAGRNVLVVVLESVSGMYLPSVAAHHRQNPPYTMKHLDAISRANISYTGFISHQRKTNRGMYALLCGELPNLLPGTPKMSEHAVAGWRECLPSVLRDAGYETVFLQGAPLSFMMKGPFMRRAGFERVEGDADIDMAHLRTIWGVDDRTLMEAALDELDELRAADRPFFLTLLTVGTHHPYVVPEDIAPGAINDHDRALQYLDKAVGEFVAELDRRGILDDTLVLITTDESAGLEGARRLASPYMKQLSQNWGSLIALVPERSRKVIHEPFAQIDIPLSILDYVGLAERGDHFFGRSIFRRYSSGRHLFFANTNFGLIGAVDPSNRVLVCNLRGEIRCSKSGVETTRLFAPQRRELEWRTPEDDLLKDVARASVAPPGRAKNVRVYPLLERSSVEIAGKGGVMVYGGQFVDLAADEWLEIELDFDVQGEPGDSINFRHTTLQNANWSIGREPENAKPFFDRILQLEVGDRLRLHYAVASESAISGVQSRAFAFLRQGDAVELHIRRAQMSVHRGPGRPVELLEVYRDEIGSAAP